MRVLVSVRDAGEALLAARAGAHFIDLKEPRDGALGALPLAVVEAIVAALAAHGCKQPTSATIGDRSALDAGTVHGRVDALLERGVHYVKVGIAPGAAALALLAVLAERAPRVVPVFIADRGIDLALVEIAARSPFAALMLDTADKRTGSLLDCVPEGDLRRFIALAGRAGRLAGLAGRLSIEQLPRLFALAADFAGFRSGVCAGDRGAALDPGRLSALLTLAAVPTHDPENGS